MRLAVLIPVLAVALAAAGCYSEGRAAGEPPGSPEPAATTTEAEEPEPRWKGAAARRYRNAYRVCSVFTPEEIARSYGVKPRPRPAARAHAQRLYERRFFRPAFRGCLDAFAGREPVV